MRTVPASPFPAADLREVVARAIELEGHLFSAGEHVVLSTILALADEPAELYARLSLREGRVFRLASLRYALDVPTAAAVLAAAGLVHDQVPDAWCLPAFDVAALKAACRRVGAPVGGSRADLEQRLRGARWVDEPVVAVRHLALLRRAEVFAFQRSGLDRSSLAAERVGALRWAAYAPTGGTGIFATRRDCRVWERAREGDWEPGEAVAVAMAGPRDAGLSPWRRAVDAVLADEPDADTLGALVRGGARVRAEWVRALLREGRVGEAYEIARAGSADPAEAVGLARAGRAAARAARRSLPPTETLVVPSRHFRAPRIGTANGRPLWRAAGREGTIELVAGALAERAGRAAVHAENALWTSLYALVFRDLYWLPVPGMLPGPRRAGPLDVGTPGFAARRRPEVERRLAELEDGLDRYVSTWQGEPLAGLVWQEAARAWASRVPGPIASAILRRLAYEGWAAARGLPDLFIASGPVGRIPCALPANLPPDALLAEVKGPTDAVRDEQAAWHQHLVRCGIHVELWVFTESPVEIT